ncbi:MAG: CotH kinase family protein [Lachnospiraceae bacterium]|nr:CotH kinase family protein [Lachnospiraceae bacterium]
MGVYLALEAVEQSFMLRNFGTQDGELYKPDSMEMGGGDRKTSSGGGFGGGMPDMGGFDFGNMPDMGGSASGNRPGRGNSGSGNRPGRGDSESGNTPDMGGFDPGSMPDMGGFGGGMPDMGGFDPGSMPDMGDFDPENMPDMGGFGGGMPDMGSFDPDSLPAGGETPAAEEGSDTEGSDTESSERQRPSGGGPGGGFSMGGNGGANLNYSDDDLDSYSTIWEGSITDTSKGDHRRVVTALKNISEGTDLETYLDVDNILKYMAVHTFAVNQDSLSGSMSHNYYLYEYNGQLNMFPWDYNLSFGGMSMGQSADATEMVNDAIDTPFSGTQFFNALLENEEYLERYHAYLQQLVDEYVNGGRFDEVYSRIRSQIDELVETDPTAFYSGDEYDVAAELLYETVKLRAESIDGQLAGTIPSTDEGQRADSSALVDASHIDVHDMGQFNMGGFVSRDSDEEASGEEGEKTDAQAASGNRRRGKMGFVQRSSDSTDSTGSENGRPDFGGFSGGMPDMGNFDFGNMPDMGGFTPGGISSQAWGKNLLIFGICLGGMLLALLGAVLYRRRPFGKKAKS